MTDSNSDSEGYDGGGRGGGPRGAGTMGSGKATAAASTGTATYAKACQNCSIAKVKCTWANGLVKCERCHRLNKDCGVKTRVRKVRQPRTSSAARAAQLEKKLDGIVSLLSVAQKAALQPKLPSLSSASTTSTPPVSIPASSSEGPSDRTYLHNYTSPHSHHHASPNANIGTFPDSPDESPRYFAQKPMARLSALDSISVSEADGLLEVFRTKLARHAPYVVVPPHWMSQELKIQKPFLYLAIMMASSVENIPRQFALGDEAMRYLGEHMLVRGQKSLDLLQGLLVYISWAQYVVYLHQQLNLLLQLCISMMVDMGLNKGTPARERLEEFVLEMKDGTHAHHHRRGLNTLDEVRAVLGCFYLSSSITASMSKLDAMRFTPHIEFCIKLVTDSCTDAVRPTSTNNDFILVSMCRLRGIVEKIRSSGLLDDAAIMKGPIGLYVGVFRAELDLFWAELPEELKSDPIMIMQFCAAEIHLYEPGFANPTPNPTVPAGTSASAPSSLNSSAQIVRNGFLSACLQAIKRSFDAMLSIEPSRYYIFTVASYGGMLHLVATLFKTFILRYEGWDLQYARSILDPSVVIGQMARNMEEAKRHFEGKSTAANWGVPLDNGGFGNEVEGRGWGGQNNDELCGPILGTMGGSVSAWGLHAKKIAWLGQCYEVRIGAELAAQENNNQAGASGGGNDPREQGGGQMQIPVRTQTPGNGNTDLVFEMGDIIRGQTFPGSKPKHAGGWGAGVVTGWGFGAGVGQGGTGTNGINARSGAETSGSMAGSGGDNFDLVDESFWADMAGDWDFMIQ